MAETETAPKVTMTRAELFLALCQLYGQTPNNATAWLGNILHETGDKVWLYRNEVDRHDGQSKTLVEIPTEFTVDNVTPKAEKLPVAEPKPQNTHTEPSLTVKRK